MTYAEAYRTLSSDLEEILSFLPDVIKEFERDVSVFPTQGTVVVDGLWRGRIGGLGTEGDGGKDGEKDEGEGRDGQDNYYGNNNNRGNGYNNNDRRTNDTEDTNDEKRTPTKLKMTQHTLHRNLQLLSQSVHAALVARDPPSTSRHDDSEPPYHLHYLDPDPTIRRPPHWPGTMAPLATLPRTGPRGLDDDIQDFRVQADFWLKRMKIRLTGSTGTREYLDKDGHRVVRFEKGVDVKEGVVVGEKVLREFKEAKRLVGDVEGLKRLMEREGGCWKL